MKVSNISTRRMIVGLVALGALAAAAVLVTQRVRAAGIPDPNRLVYSGYLEKSDGTPETDEQTMELGLYDLEAGGTPICPLISQAVTPVAGRFQIQLGEECTALVSGEPNIWIEIKVGGTVVGRTQLGAVPYAVEADNAQRLQGKAPSEFAGSNHTHAFASLDTLPAGLADGDDDTKYTAGTGLDLSAQNAFSVDPAEVQTRVSGTCAAGSSIRTISQGGTVTCQTDNDTTYLAGPGLSLTSNQFGFDASELTWCGAGQGLRSISGTVATCENIPVITSWTAFSPVMKESDGVPNPVPSQTTTGYYRRVGDSVEVMTYTVLSAAGAAGSYYAWQLPPGLVFGTMLGTYSLLGVADVLNANGNQVHICGVIKAGADVAVDCDEATNSLSGQSPYALGSSSTIHMRYTARISGW